MEEKERYEVMSPSLNGYAYIHDFKTDNVLNTYDSCDLLNQQSKRIKELENENKQLKQQVEFYKEENKINKKDCDYYFDEYTLCKRKIKDLEQEKQQLKQQLHDLPKKIVGEITNELSNNTSLYFEIRESTSAHCPNKEYEWFNYVRFRNYINTILEKFGGEDE